MKHKFFYAMFLAIVPCVAQQIHCTALDRNLFEVKMKELSKLNATSLGDSLVQIGQTFLGTPYVEKTLEVGQTETLVINLRGLDCTTFVENTLALGLLMHQNKNDFDSFAEILKTIRYRNGELNGYPSRLHYFTEWIRNNQTKGLVNDITNELGGVSLNKPINFMGSHRSLYPFLENDENYERILQIEVDLAKEAFCYIPQNDILEHESLIHSGDIIALATSIKGLDVTHTGFAIKMADGRIHLLHASSTGAVKITQVPLLDYLKKIKGNIGIVVARPSF